MNENLEPGLEAFLDALLEATLLLVLQPVKRAYPNEFDKVWQDIKDRWDE